MAQSDSFTSLLESILMPMDLGENSAELHLQARNDDQFAHSIADALLFEVD